ncbi:ammonium transporter [Psychrobacter sp. PP-21]|uniref:ammonium transporter n=1 Tax=Psychrobacter sp. PP-21 TaxID=2957503 RepID=UPI0029A75AE3|nr:ammonium transporter [Psychrobacter sp. PP-21]MDX2374554.1 ammonium transporter [Psychrobacter sp. PP-21]
MRTSSVGLDVLEKLLKSSLGKILVLNTLLFGTIASAQAAEADTLTVAQLLEYQNIAWIIWGGVLVFFMQAGFALLESGSVRAKNAVNVMMKNYTDMCIGGLAFYLVGFGLMMGTNHSGFVGTDHFMPVNLSNMDWALMFFQMMFAATAVTIASGAMAERVSFIGYAIAACLICLFIYPVFASWVWGGYFGGSGWLAERGFIDFAGSTVVHSIGGWLALAGVLVIGPRLGRFAPDGTPRLIAGHNMTLLALGGFILWFGWFGFNAGSTLSITGDIGLIAVNTFVAAVSAVVSYMLISRTLNKAILLSDSVNASLIGLVSITAGCATTTPLYSIIIGGVAAVVYILSTQALLKLKIDDVVSAVAVHGFGGVWGTLAAGLFYTGDLFNLSRLGVQALGVGVALVWALGLGLIMYKLIDLSFGLKASRLHEQRGLDYTEHAELGYPEFQKQMFDAKSLTERHL